MNLCRSILIIGVASVLTSQASAGIFFNRHPKPNPQEQVPSLIQAVKIEPDDHKRAVAAEQLREFDPATFPEIVPVLIDVAEHDPKPAVRSEALQSLARLRPVSQEAGMALEQAAEHDASFRVRLQARTCLMAYRMSGYRTGKKDSPVALPATGTGEPPLAEPAPTAAGTSGMRPSKGSYSATQGPPPPLVPAQPPQLEPAPSDGPALEPPQ